jgi:hypothetical protein
MGPDSCTRIGAVEMDTPDGPGPLILELALVGDGVRVANRYETAIEA